MLSIITCFFNEGSIYSIDISEPTQRTATRRTRGNRRAFLAPPVSFLCTHISLLFFFFSFNLQIVGRRRFRPPRRPLRRTSPARLLPRRQLPSSLAAAPPVPPPSNPISNPPPQILDSPLLPLPPVHLDLTSAPASVFSAAGSAAQLLSDSISDLFPTPSIHGALLWPRVESRVGSADPIGSRQEADPPQIPSAAGRRPSHHADRQASPHTWAPRFCRKLGSLAGYGEPLEHDFSADSVTASSISPCMLGCSQARTLMWMDAFN